MQLNGMRRFRHSLIALLAITVSYSCLASIDDEDIAKFNKDYAEIQELISNGQLREAGDGALATTPLAELVFNTDPENLANYYYLVAQLHATQPWSGMARETVPIARRAVEMMSSLYGDASDEALRAHASMLRILTLAIREADARKERESIASTLRVQTTKTLKLIKDVETAAAADLYLALSGSAQTIRTAKKYSDSAAEIFASVYGAKSKEAIQAKVASTRFLKREKQIRELTSILESIDREKNLLLLKAGIHQKLAVLHVLGGEEETSMRHNIAASEAFELLGQAEAILASDYMPIVTVNPKYPRRAQTRGIEGYVLLEYVVDKTGRVVNPRVIKAKPRGTFNKAAIEATKLYRYLPAIKEGRPIAVEGVKTRITFEMAD
ncbi:MAG TPA: hypothetical protein DEF72_08940 [Gammaproteobacteria bacterium]|nr:hypothetical protein [Gammaproteobacteria bacterium]